MSARRDRLESLQRLREIREDQAKAAVARAQRAHDEAEEHKDQARRRATDAMRPLRGSVGSDGPDEQTTSMPVSMVRALQIAGWASAEELGLAEQEFERTVERRSESQRQLKDAAIGRRSVEKLAQRREADAVARLRDAADRAMDELFLQTRELGS